MSFRRALSKSGSSSRKSKSSEQASRDATCDEDDRREQENINPDVRKRRNRVALRSGSPKSSSRLTLRTTRPRILLATPSFPKAQHLSTTATKVGTTSQPNFRLKSPIKQSWVAPTMRSPAYHERSLSSRRTVFKIPQEIARPRLRKPPAFRYSVAELVALRPPAIAIPESLRRAAITTSEVSEHTIIHHEQIPSFLHTTPGVYGHYFPIVPQNKLLAWRSEKHPLHQEIWPSNGGLMEPLNCAFGNGGLYQEETHGYTPRHSTGFIPARGSIKDCSSEDQAATVEDLESRIRSALSNRGGRRSVGASRNVRSVRWDPALLAAGPETPSHPMTREAIDNSENEREAVQHAFPTKDAACPSQEAEKTEQKKQKKEFYQYMNSVTELKRGDRMKLLQLLEALNHLDTDDSSNSETESEKLRKSRKVKNVRQGRRLNPAAVSFNNSLGIFAQSPSVRLQERQVEPHENVSRGYVRAPENYNPDDPTWVNTSDLIRKDQRNGLDDRRRENASHPLMKTPRTLLYFEDHPSRLTRSLEDFQSETTPEISYNKPPYQGLFQSESLHPVASLPHRGIPIPLLHPPAPLPEGVGNVNPNLPIINLATGRTPNELDHGREAHVVPWGASILERFQEKYPLTGRMRAKPPAPVKRTHAATIQQRLEYLLMEQKERKARVESLQERVSNAKDPGGIQTLFQIEKQVMKRLKSEIRKDELERKSREFVPPSTHYKVLVHDVGSVTAMERVSEASTCDESTRDTEGFDDQGDKDRLT